MKTVRSIAKGARKQVVQSAQVIDGVVKAAAIATVSVAKDSILSSNTALSAYSIFKASSLAVKVGATAIAVAAMGPNN